MSSNVGFSFGFPVESGIVHFMQIDEHHLEEDSSDPLPTRKETGPLMFLSLFLLLLAFFILLNTISTLRETKSRDVLSSVAATFQTQADPDQNAEILVSTIGQVLEPDLVLDEVERLWQTEVPFVKVETITQGRHIAVELPVFQLFVSAEAQIRGDRADLVAATAHALSQRLPGDVVVMQAILFVEDLETVSIQPPARATPVLEALDPDDPDAALPPPLDLDEQELAFNRAGVLAQTLTNGGVPNAHIEIGLRTGNPQRLRFRFYVRDENRSWLTFSDEVEGVVPASPDGEGAQ